MHSKIFITLIVLFVASYVDAQDDDTIEFRQGLPMTGEDSTAYDNVDENFPPDHFVRLSPEDVPRKLRRSLDATNGLFTNWRKQEIYHDERTGIYWITFPEGDVVRRYGFTENGDPVRVAERDTGP